MLKKKERLTRKEFDRFFSSGRRRHDSLFTLVYASHPSFHGAVVVGKKVFKRATDRNRLRRRLYSLLQRLSKGENRQGVYIVLTKPAAASAKFEELREAIEKLIKV